MSMNLVKTVVGYMKSRPEEKFTARQLAEWECPKFCVRGLNGYPTMVG